jgi:ectoine hydroxylase-related dioxygenase (phytanoyl-CoA dioxygenase family)
MSGAQKRAMTHALPAHAAEALREEGYTVLPGPVAPEEIAELQSSYDAACAQAAPEDVGLGRASTRVTDFVNRGPEFDCIYTWLLALYAARQVIQGPFRLSAMHARTLRPGARAQELHADIPPSSDAWPMLGLIYMIDEFTKDNGATRFVPGSHRWTESPEAVLVDRYAPYPGQVVACGPPGSVILFDASTWHGHTSNRTSAARRSLQATYIPRSGRPATDFVARMKPETFARLGGVARYLIGESESFDAPQAPEDRGDQASKSSSEEC